MAPLWATSPSPPCGGTGNGVMAPNVRGRLSNEVDQAQAIRPRDRHSVAVGDRSQFRLRRGAIRAGLGEARGEHDRGPHAALSAFFQRLHDPMTRDHEDRAVDLVWQRRYRRQGPDAVDLGPAPADQAERALHRERAQVGDRRAADGVGVVGGAD